MRAIIPTSLRGAKRRSNPVLLACLLLVACSPGGPVEDAKPDPVVVYAGLDDKTYLPALFDAFTKETGYIVIVRHGDAAAMVEDVIANDVSPPADVLWTPSAIGVWQAAEEGALRPLASDKIDGTVAPWLVDPDEFWVAASFRSAVLAFDPRVIDANELGDYAALADSHLQGKLCLSTSSLPINRAVIAMMINAVGKRATEIAVRGWVANLAMPVFDGEKQLLRAIETGVCAVGIASSAAVSGYATLATHIPTPAHADIEGLGVARHARNPEGAVALVEWLITANVQQRHSAATSQYPVLAGCGMPIGIDVARQRNVVFTALLAEEALRLAERARYD